MQHRIPLWKVMVSNRLNRISCKGKCRAVFASPRSNSQVAYISSKSKDKRFAFPEQLLIYHAGTGRTVFLGCLKLTTIFICGFFSLVVLPKHILADRKVPWVTCTIAVSGFAPMLFVAYVTGPFVTYIHLRIPAFARNSKDMIIRFAKSPPKETQLDFTIMNFFGKPQVARMKLKDIYPVRERFGMVNFVRDTDEINSKRVWWKGKVVRHFGVHGKDSGFLRGDVWKLIKMNIQKNKFRSDKNPSLLPAR